MDYVFTSGFLGTRAPLFMDIVSVIVFFLPFLIFGAISLAKRGHYDAHETVQKLLFVISVIVVGFFEYGPSTFGNQESFLELLSNPDNIDYDKNEFDLIQPYLSDLDIGEIKDSEKIIKDQLSSFSKEEEYGLLNRLDNDTAWFLYFAKTLDFYNNYKSLQSNNQIIKYYFARVRWKPEIKEISYEIMHHKTKADRMIPIIKPQDIHKGRSKPHSVYTELKILKYDNQTDTSDILVQIHKGIRHQIRVHLSSIGHPIIWDTLYWSDQDNKNLQLFSLWCRITTSN